MSRGRNARRIKAAGLGCTVGALLVLIGLALPVFSQGTGGFVGLPSPSTVTGPLHRNPDGSIATEEPNTAPAPAAPSTAAPRARTPGTSASGKTAPGGTAQTAPPPSTAAPTPGAPNPAAPSPAAPNSAPPSAAAPNPAPPAPAAPAAITVATVTMNVANAPGWRPSTTYVTGDRVVAGPGYLAAEGNCTPSHGTCTNRRSIYLWALTGGSGGSSAGSGNGPQDCDKPAGVGGIPSGSWGAASTAHDGALTWTCLVKVDYVTLTSALVDDATHWAPNAGPCTGAAQAGCYYARQYVVHAGIAWQQTNEVWDKPPYQCASATSGSGPTPGAGPWRDGTCAWQPVAAIPYTSGVTPWSHQLHDLGRHPRSQLTHNLVINLWYGGKGQPQYVAGTNDESNPLQSRFHQEMTSDVYVLCPDGKTAWGDCIAPGRSYVPTVQAAPGDGLCDQTDAPLFYDSARGVALFSGSRSAWRPDDGGMVTNCLQMKSTSTEIAFCACEHSNLEVLTNSIVDSTADTSAEVDAVNYVANNLIINRSGTPGTAAILTSYTSTMINNTVIGTGSAESGACIVQRTLNFVKNPLGDLGAPPLSNNLCFGFQTLVASATPYTGKVSDHNGTDQPDVAEPRPFRLARGFNLSGYSFGGANNLFKLSAREVFVNPVSDFRLRPGSPARGAGAPFSMASGNWQGVYQNPTDFFGRVRRPSYDLGAHQSPEGHEERQSRVKRGE
jgi:hypothetical protein